MLYNNKYQEAPVTGDNSFIVNIGKLVDDIIDNHLTNVRHRVAEVKDTRYSITYFLGPQLVTLRRELSSYFQRALPHVAFSTCFPTCCVLTWILYTGSMLTSADL